MKQAKARGYKVKLRYADYDWSVRGVFFRGHELGNSSSSEQQQQCTLLQPAGIGELFLPSSALPSAASAKQQQRQHEPESAQLTRDRAQSDSVD